MHVSLWGGMRVVVGGSTEEMAAIAAADFAAAARDLIHAADSAGPSTDTAGPSTGINVLFAGAESQRAFHAALRARADIAWDRINAFSVDEFLAPGLPAECAVSAQPRRDLYRHVHPRSVNVIDPLAADPDAECRRYAELVTRNPPQICCMGVGTSGHLALNEPGDTDFDDPAPARIVRVAEQSKRQLAGDPNFRSLPAIPDRGITLTVPVLLSAAVTLAVVPYALKADIVACLARSAVRPDLPASIMKKRGNVTLYLDPGSASGLGKDG